MQNLFLAYNCFKNPYVRSFTLCDKLPEAQFSSFAFGKAFL